MRLLRTAAVGAVLLAGGTVMAGAAEGETPLYHPAGMWTWDYWFAKQGDMYYAFYLQAPFCLGDPHLKHGNQHVGHAMSKDLVHWTDLGPAAVPINGTWNDRAIATGSTVAHAGKWWMLFTGVGSKGGGVGLAVSDDLVSWRKVGDGPVAPLGKPFEAAWEGKPVRWCGLADPYVLPEPVDGWHVMVINARILDVPIQESGCLALMRSRDLQTWEPGEVIAWPRLFERLETPQLWQRNGRWHLYFGGAHDHGVPEAYAAAMPDEGLKKATRVNGMMVAETLTGPYRLAGKKWWLTLPDGKWGYIAKVLADPAGRDVLFMSVGDKLSRPYPVTYEADGSLTLGMP